MKPDPLHVTVFCPICGKPMELSVKVDNAHTYWGKAGYCHQVTASYTPDEDGILEVVAFFEPARD